MKRRGFLDLVVDAGLIPQAQAHALNDHHQGNALAALEELMATHSAPREDLCRLFGDSLGTAYVDLISCTTPSLYPLQYPPCILII